LCFGEGVRPGEAAGLRKAETLSIPPLMLYSFVTRREIGIRAALGADPRQV
jgi:hypothetical protein